ncbi:DUF459 domain-containing protein [uncultured Brevundimonas sp.]|uniref:SGNH/GDSL hydrolase family protein n=1 Tax=uncultured Brevundimonas sp. TaxID=213418 RepID=UPI0030EC0D26
MRAGINALTVAFVVGVLAGLALSPDGRAWLRHPTLLLGATANASAPAETTPTPVVPAAAPVAVGPVITPLETRLAQGKLRIGVFGDSMADGLWAALYRDLNPVPGLSVTKFSEVSTGLSRYDYVDIQAKTARQLDEQPVDVAVILFGTNDAQGISLDGEVHRFGTDGWKAAYGQRIEDLVTLLRGRDVAVYWVGLPRMKREGFDAKMTLINEVVAERMAALDVPYIETVPLTSNAAGGYEAYLPTDTGRRTLMRANDGIHMSMAGYLRIGDPVAARLKRDAGLERPRPGTGDGMVSASTPPVSPAV